jgi:hypothetical protein
MDLLLIILTDDGGNNKYQPINLYCFHSQAIKLYV